MSSVATFPHNLTWDEFLNLPGEIRNASLIDGEVVVNSPSYHHARVVKNLTFELTTWIRARGGYGEPSTQPPIKVHERQGHLPDFVWYAEPLPPGGPDAPWYPPGPPALIVEILSPSTRRRDLMVKRTDYETIGIPEAWFVEAVSRSSPAVYICRRPSSGQNFTDLTLEFEDELTSPLLEGFKIRVAELYES